MPSLSGSRPKWLTFDCYGTLAQWDEGLISVVDEILASHDRTDLNAATFISVYDRHEHAAEQEPVFKDFKTVSAQSLEKAMQELEMTFKLEDARQLVSRIASFPPFPEVPETLGILKNMGYNLCVISNTDDDLIAGNVRQMGGHIDCVVTAEQAHAYKPSSRIFAHAHAELGVTKDEVLHICASPHLDLVAARDIGFRCIWVDRGTARKPLADYSPDAVVSQLDSVPDILSVF